MEVKTSVNKTRVAKMAAQFRRDSQNRRAKLAKQKAEAGGDREEKAAKAYLNKASIQLAKRKEKVRDEVSQHKNASVKGTTDVTKTKTASSSVKKSGKALNVAKTVARLAISPNREINRWKNTLYNKLKEENTMSVIQGSKEHLKKLQKMLDSHKKGSTDHSQIRHAISSMFGDKHIPKQHRVNEDTEMDDVEQIINKIKPDDLEKMDTDALRSAFAGKIEVSAEEEKPSEEPKSVQQDHAEKMPDNGPTPEGETPETVAQRYAKAISGLAQRQNYSTFTGKKGGW